MIRSSFLTAILSVSLLAGCVTQKLQGYRAESTLYSTDSALLSELAQLQLATIMPTAAEAEPWAAVHEILGRLSPKPDLHIRVSIVDAPFPNAMALPNGKVLVTRGLLQLARSEHEVAAVLAHEIGHVQHRHSEARFERLNYGFFGDYLFTHFADQAEELEADLYSLELLKKGSYDPQGFIDFLNNLRALETRESIRFGGFGSSHPSLEKRIGSYRDAAQKAGLALGDAPSQSRKFATMKAAFVAQLDPRFRPGGILAGGSDENIDVRKVLLESGTALVQDLDLRRAAKRLKSLLARTDLSPKTRADVHVSLAYIAVAHAAFDEVGVELSAAEKLLSDHWSVKWLKVYMLRARGERDQAESEWWRLFNDPRCAANLSCRSLGLTWAALCLHSIEEQGRAARIYRETLLVSSGGLSRSDLDIDHMLSIGLETEILAGLRNDPEERQKPRPTPSGFKPTLRLVQVQAIEREYNLTGRSFPYQEHAMVFGLGGGASAYAGALSSIGSVQPGIDMWAGYRFWPWEAGAGVNGSFASGRIGVDPPDTKYEVLNLAFYLRRDRSYGRTRTWSKFDITISEVRYSPSGSMISSLSTGFGAGYEMGIGYRLGASRSATDVWLVGWGAVNPVWHPSGTSVAGFSLGGMVQLGIEFTLTDPHSLGNDVHDSDIQNALNGKLPTFF